MTIKHRMLLGAIVTGVLVTSLVAQNPPPTPVPADPPPPPLVPASEPATPAPAPTKKVEKKSPVSKKPSTAKKTTETERRPAGKLKPGQAVATEKNVNVRGQAKLNSEIVTHLKRGDVVTVVEYVTTKAPANEPSEWAKILLPAGSAVWVNASFIESGKVKPNRLNLRSGPGENYSILGRIDKGTAVHELERKGEWIKIEAPTNSYAFAWARLFSQEPAHLAAALAAGAPKTSTAAVQEKPVETTAVTPAPVIVPATETPVQPPVAPPPTPDATASPAVVPEPPPAPAETTATPDTLAEAQPLIKRVVTREGFVKGSASIQAPTYFVLRGLETSKTINYLHTTDTNIALRTFMHQRVIVTGEEMLDERWPNTPVIDVESIEAVP
ncbi:MAG TPA: SH3 domain-containing protein [Verrucomicrobiae bacterium]|nr:SH3 domain-containing protein [Verrucomicrobiae bacterium]